MYAKLFKEIGEAWDMEQNDVGMAITLLDYLKQDVLQQQPEPSRKERTDLIVELIELSIQHFSGNQLAKPTSNFTPSRKPRNSKRIFDNFTPSSSSSSSSTAIATSMRLFRCLHLKVL